MGHNRTGVCGHALLILGHGNKVTQHKMQTTQLFVYCGVYSYIYIYLVFRCGDTTPVAHSSSVNVTRT